MGKNYESDKEVTSSNISISFDELQDAFDELHSESIKLAKLVSSSKKTILDLEKEISKLNKVLDLLKTEVSIFKSSTKVNDSTMTNEKENSCKCCSKYVEENKYLKNSLAKFSIGKNNLYVILGKQRCVFDKVGIGFKPKKQQKFYKNFFASTQKYNSPFITCFNCARKGHGTSTCYFRKNCNNIKMMWVPKGFLVNTNIQGPNKFLVPKSQT